MGIYDRQYYREEPRGFSLESLTRGRSVVMILIGINIAVFVLDAVLGPSGPVFANQQPPPGKASELLKLSVSDLTQPWLWWRFLTCGFAHGGAAHLFGNMIGLFFFGRVAEQVYGSRKFLWMYLTAILAGSLVWVLSARLSGFGGSVLGASGGVVAVVILFCLKFPHQKVFLLILPFVGIPAWVLGLVYVGSDLMGAFGFHQNSNVAFLVHLTGAAYAYLFFRTQWELSQAMPFLAAGSVGNLFKSRPKLRVHSPETDEQLASKADAILDKLHREGEASLTARERKILEQYSRSIKQKNR